MLLLLAVAVVVLGATAATLLRRRRRRWCFLQVGELRVRVRVDAAPFQRSIEQALLSVAALEQERRRARVLRALALARIRERRV